MLVNSQCITMSSCKRHYVYIERLISLIGVSNYFEQNVIKNLSHFCVGCSRFQCKVVFTMYYCPLEITETCSVQGDVREYQVIHDTIDRTSCRQEEASILTMYFHDMNANFTLFLCLLCDPLVFIDCFVRKCFLLKCKCLKNCSFSTFQCEYLFWYIFKNCL